MPKIDLTSCRESAVTAFKAKTAVIIKFGPAGFQTDGFKPGEYYTVTIDPEKVCGEYIRFGDHPGDEITGWQRIEAMTVVQVLGEVSGAGPHTFQIGVESVGFKLLQGE